MSVLANALSGTVGSVLAEAVLFPVDTIKLKARRLEHTNAFWIYLVTLGLFFFVVEKYCTKRWGLRPFESHYCSYVRKIVTPTLSMNRSRLPMLQITEASSTSAISLRNPILCKFLRRFHADSGLGVGQCLLAQNLNGTMHHQYHQPSRCYSCHSPQHSNKTLESKVGIKAWLESLRDPDVQHVQL